MLSSEFIYDELLGSDKFAVKQYRDSLYRGELIDRVREGKGVIVYNSGRVYEGEWSEDKRHGKGFEKFTNGNTYEGEYFQGKP